MTLHDLTRAARAPIVSAAIVFATTLGSSGCSDCGGSTSDASAVDVTSDSDATTSDHGGPGSDATSIDHRTTTDGSTGSDSATGTDRAGFDASVDAGAGDSAVGHDSATVDSGHDAGPTDAAPGLDAQLGCDATPLPVSPSGSGRYRTLANLPYPGLQARDVVVYLPAAYETETTRRFGVVYLHDGQNLFDAALAFGGIEWQVDETLDALIEAGAIPPQIAVGIDNTSDRMSDYTPDVDTTYGGGNGAAYARFVACAVKPTVDALFRTAPARANTVVMGSSLGGLISLYIYKRYPQLFGGVGAVSPSLWWNDRSPIASFSDFTGPLPARLWLDIGTAEGGSYDFLPYPVVDARDLRDRALARGGVLGDNFGYLEDRGAQHDETAWAGRLDAIFNFLLAPQRLSATAPRGLDLFAYRGHLDATGNRSQTSLAVTTWHGAHGRLTWPNDRATLHSGNDAVATVDSAGTVRASASGTTNIDAQLLGVNDSTPIVVGGSDVVVTFLVHVPAAPAMPASDSVHVVGDLAGLGAWDGVGAPLSLHDTDTWVGEVVMPANTSFEYKFTRGGWATVEKNSDGSERANRTGNSDALLFEDAVARWADQ